MSLRPAPRVPISVPLPDPRRGWEGSDSQEEVAPLEAVVEKEAGIVAFGMALGEVDDIPSQAKVKDGLRLFTFTPAETAPAYALFQGYRKFVEPLSGDPSRGRTAAVTATSFIDRLPEAELDRRQVEMSREWAEALKQVQRDLACSFVKQPRQGNDMVWQARLAGSGKVEARFTVAANPDGTYQILRLVTVTTDDAK